MKSCPEPVVLERATATAHNLGMPNGPKHTSALLQRCKNANGLSSTLSRVRVYRLLLERSCTY